MQLPFHDHLNIHKKTQYQVIIQPSLSPKITIDVILLIHVNNHSNRKRNNYDHKQQCRAPVANFLKSVSNAPLEKY